MVATKRILIILHQNCVTLKSPGDPVIHSLGMATTESRGRSRLVKHGRGLIPPACLAPETVFYYPCVTFFFSISAPQPSYHGIHRPAIHSFTLNHCLYSPGGGPFSAASSHKPQHHSLPQDSLTLFSHYILISHAWSSRVIEHRLCRDLPFPRNQCLGLSVLLPIDHPRVSNRYRIRVILRR